MWRLAVLPVLLAAAACSRSPAATEAYSQAWEAFRQGKLEHAQQLVDLALKTRRDQAETLEPLRLLQAEILLARGQARAAEDVLNGLPDPRTPLLHLRWLVDRADALSKRQQADLAISLLDQVDRTAGSNESTDPVLRGRLLRGAILARADKFDAAEQVLQQTAALAARAGDTFNQAGALLNLSFSKYNRQRYDESLSYSRPALEAAEKVHAGRLAGLANNNLGMAYTVLRDLDRAEEYLNKAIAQLREIGDLRNLENALGNLGNVHLQTHQAASAVRDFQEAVGIAKSIDAKSDVARWVGRLSLAFTEQQKWAEAESSNREAESLTTSLHQPNNLLYLKMNAAAIANGLGKPEEAARLYRELIARASAVPYLEWNAHVRLGSLLADERQFRDANVEYERGLAVLEQVRSTLIHDDYRLTYQDALMEFFKDYVDLLVLEKENDRALQIADSSRARLLAEKLGLDNNAMGEMRPAALQSYASRHGEVLVSYWLAPRRSFVWTVSSSGIHMKTLPGQKEIEDLVRTYQTSIQDLRDPVADGMPQAERLSQVLLGPIQGDLAGARRVVIVPDGGLHALNLETLPVPGTNRYWIDDAEISLAPSLSMLVEAPPRNREKPSLLLIGAPNAAGAEYPELPAAKSEIEAIRSRFAERNPVIRMGPDATPQGFLDAMPGRFSMIHFAAHAETNSQSPLESAIILSRSGERFKLYARDIAALKLSADLVTISACRSAGARSYGGEGLVGFTWAFLRSGARSVIAGLWDVSDLSSSELIPALYQELASGKQPAAALRQAKRTLLHSAGPYRKPYYWAPFQTYIR
jgi:CHAT domain-containing protein/thioredoxin-like negative regulator of GroEL